MLKLSLSGEKTGEISCFPCCHGHDDNAATKAWLAACRCEYTGRYALLLSTLSALCSPMREAALMTHQCGAVHCPSVLKCHQCQMQGMCRSPLMLTRITFIIGRFFKYLSLYIYTMGYCMRIACGRPSPRICRCDKSQSHGVPGIAW